MDLEAFVRAACLRGSTFDLSGIGYGRIHWGDKQRVEDRPPKYYSTLAGVAAVSGAKTCLEIGTHWGGSANAIMAGMVVNDAESRTVTIDITAESDNYIPNSPYGQRISKIVGDANTWPIIGSVRELISSVDFLYIDADHRPLPTFLNFCLYERLLNPKIAVFDDILLTEGMREFWALMKSVFPHQTINMVDIEPKARDKDCGFGVWVAPGFLEQVASPTG